MRVRGRELNNVPVESILAQYEWADAKWTDEKLICRSPFRYDGSPSFFVRLQPSEDFPEGLWSDSAGTGEWRAGTFPKLYGFLKGITTEEAELELLEIYANEFFGYRENLTINIPRISLKKEYRRLKPESFQQKINTYHPYLEKRGISKEVANELGIGYDAEREAVVFLWKDGSGTIQNAKYRSINSKIFWYEDGCKPISEMIYNLDYVYKHRPKTVVLTESEIDSAYMTHICPSVALGGSNFSDKKADLLRKAPFSNLVIATDNDQIGEKMRDLIISKLKHHKNIYILPLPSQYKDVNDVPDLTELKQYLQASKKIKLF